MKTVQNQPSRHVFTVSELTARIKTLLEQKYSMLWISAEISNLRVPTSGHAYFTLKDAKAQISAVMFKGQRRQLKFDLEDGQSITGLGRLSVYEPRGTYQIILEYVEPKGIGALQVAFEQLKQKLHREGLFDAVHKKALPFIPRSLAVVTAPTGAVVRDILDVLKRRYASLPVTICPVRVQGDSADRELARAIELINAAGEFDLILIARGGGSLEDLAPFNSELLARAIAASDVPVVSAVGHETDVTIADYVADLRAATPSVAAELIVPRKADLDARCRELALRCVRSIQAAVQRARDRFERQQRALVHPGKSVQDAQIHVDQLTVQVQRNMAQALQNGHARVDRVRIRLDHVNPLRVVEKHKVNISINRYKLIELLHNNYSAKKEKARSALALLTALNPDRILKRGYSITRTLPRREILRSVRETQPGQPVDIQLAEGHLLAVVRKTEP